MLLFFLIEFIKLFVQIICLFCDLIKCTLDSNEKMSIINERSRKANKKVKVKVKI